MNGSVSVESTLDLDCNDVNSKSGYEAERKLIFFKDVVVLQGPSCCYHWEKNVSHWYYIDLLTDCKFSASPCGTTCMSLGSCPSINAVTKSLVFNLVESCNVYSCRNFLWVLPASIFALIDCHISRAFSMFSTMMYTWLRLQR